MISPKPVEHQKSSSHGAKRPILKPLSLGKICRHSDFARIEQRPCILPVSNHLRTGLLTSLPHVSHCPKTISMVSGGIISPSQTLHHLYQRLIGPHTTDARLCAVVRAWLTFCKRPVWDGPSPNLAIPSVFFGHDGLTLPDASKDISLSYIVRDISISIFSIRLTFTSFQV